MALVIREMASISSDIEGITYNVHLPGSLNQTQHRIDVGESMIIQDFSNDEAGDSRPGIAQLILELSYTVYTI